MKNVKIKLFATLAALALGGCSGSFKQDPLDGSGLNGAPPSTPIEAPKGDDPSAVRIDSLDTMTFVEGVAGEYKITGRVLIPDFTAEVKIENLSEFPGATYNAQTGTFTWTPASNYIGSGTYVDKELQVTILARPTTGAGTVRSGTRSIIVHVTASQQTPTWVSVTQADRKVFENQKRTVTVQFDDTKADPNNSTTFARVIISSPTSSSKNLAPFVTVQSVTPAGGTRFTATLQIDLTDIEITSDYDEAEFKVQTINRMNLVSAAETVSLRLYTDLKEPAIIWEAPTFNLGVAGTHTFMVYNPKFEGDLSVRLLNAPWGSTLTCGAVVQARVTCVFAGTPTAVPASGTFNLQIEATSSAGDWSHQIRKPKTFTAPVRVTP